jgi:hypothetical protein
VSSNLGTGVWQHIADACSSLTPQSGIANIQSLFLTRDSAGIVATVIAFHVGNIEMLFQT